MLYQTGVVHKKSDSCSVIKVDRRIRWHYTTTILRLRIGARLTRYRNGKFHNGCRTISRHADGISRYSVPYRLVPAHFYPCSCWTHAQKGLGSKIAGATLLSNSFRQTVYTHCTSVHQAAKLVAALLRVARVTAGLAKSNGSLPPGL